MYDSREPRRARPQSGGFYVPARYLVLILTGVLSLISGVLIYSEGIEFLAPTSPVPGSPAIRCGDDPQCLYQVGYLKSVSNLVGGKIYYTADLYVPVDDYSDFTIYVQNDPFNTQIQGIPAAPSLPGAASTDINVGG